MKEKKEEPTFVIESWDDFGKQYKKYLKTLPLYLQLWKRIWPLPYNLAPWRWVQNWSYDKFGIPFRFKFFVQRMNHGWSDGDRWNLDSFLARTIAQSFKDWNPHGIAPVRIIISFMVLIIMIWVNAKNLLLMDVNFGNKL
jgi:hypothetical protein